MYGIQGKDKSGANTYACPVYENSKRTDLTFVATIDLNIPKAVKQSSKRGGDDEEIKAAIQLPSSDSRLWELLGTAMICNVN